MKKVVVFLLILLNVSLVMCSSNNVSNDEVSQMKEIVDKVLSYNGSYDENINSYIDEETFYNSNYVVFYSYYIGKATLEKYESIVKGVTKDKNSYNLCMVINMEANGEVVESDEEGDHYDTAEGNDVPIEVVLTKNNKGFFIESVKEYESLEIAQNENKNFK